MYGVFPKFLKQDVGKCPVNGDLSIRKVIDHLAQTKSEAFTWEFIRQPHVFVKSALTRNEYFGRSDYITECYTNDAFRSVCEWVNKNIILQMTKDTYITTGVKVRIATSMINKLVTQEKFSKDYAVLAHEILVSNVKELAFQIDSEDLPF